MFNNIFNKKEEQPKPMDDSEALRFKMNGEPVMNEQHSGKFTEDGREIHYYDEKTLHGIHYTEEEFYAEAERRYNTYCGHYPHLAEDAEKINFVMDTFKDWNNPDDDRTIQFLHLYNNKTSGYTKITNEDEIPDTENWQPVMGVSLLDYAQSQSLLQKQATNEDELCKAFGIEKPIWDEIQAKWNSRFSDEGREMFDAYMRFQTQPIQNPKLQALIADVETSDYVHQYLTDDYFWAEINAIIMSAGKYGIDSIQYLQDNYQITMGDYSAGCVAISERNNGSVPIDVQDYMKEKEEEYDLLFSKETGGNVADDVNF